MTYTTHPHWGLPDPETQGDFYESVPAKRLVAWAIDTVIVALLTALTVIFTAFIAAFFLPLVWLVLSFAYRMITIANRSATPGMRLTGIEFRNASGERFDLGTAFAHTLLYSLSVAFVVPQVISVILMMTGARAQGLSDHILSTAAINRPRG